MDAIVAEGFEAGGHNGRDEITTMVLIPQVVDAVKERLALADKAAGHAPTADARISVPMPIEVPRKA